MWFPSPKMPLGIGIVGFAEGANTRGEEDRPNVGIETKGR